MHHVFSLQNGDDRGPTTYCEEMSDLMSELENSASHTGPLQYALL